MAALGESRKTAASKTAHSISLDQEIQMSVACCGFRRMDPSHLPRHGGHGVQGDRGTSCSRNRAIAPNLTPVCS